jgi:hypothetical protein
VLVALFRRSVIRLVALEHAAVADDDDGRVMIAL